VKVAALVLAAGGSSRLGQPKQLLSFHGQTLVRRVILAAWESGCCPIKLVLGAERASIEAELEGCPVDFVPNESWASGIGSSIRAGMQALSDCAAVVILTSDQPHVDAGLIRDLCRARAKENLPVIASAYAGTLGVPALFDRSFFPQLEALGDSSGAKSIIDAHSEKVAAIHFPLGAIDIDTPADLEHLA
jgi:molybdenum cofactor cytidylyltransferase